MIKVKIILLGVAGLFLFFILAGSFGGWLSSVSPEAISGLQSFKSTISNSKLFSYAVIVLMAVYFEPVVKLFIKNTQQRELLLNSKTTIRLCVASYIVLSEGLPLLLNGGWS